MKTVEVKEQARPPLRRCAELVLSGIKYRLFRASITVAIIALATAFLMTMLTESLVTRQVATAIGAETADRERLQFWVGRLTSLPDAKQFSELLAGASQDGPRWEEFKAWGGLTDTQMQELSEIARRQRTYSSFFEGLSEGQRRPLVQRNRGEKILAFLINQGASTPERTVLREERVGALETELTRLGEKFPTSFAEFTDFLKNWHRTLPLREGILAGHEAALDQLRQPGGLLADSQPRDVLATGDASIVQKFADAGFGMSPDEHERIRRVAALSLDAERVERTLGAAMLKTRLAERLDVTNVASVNPQMLFSELSSGSGAEWFVELTDSTRGLQVRGLTADRIADAAASQIRNPPARQTFGFWVRRLSQPLTPEQAVEELTAAELTTERRRSFRDWAKLGGEAATDEQIDLVRRIPRLEQQYKAYFKDLSPAHRQQMGLEDVTDDTFAYLDDPTHFEDLAKGYRRLVEIENAFLGFFANLSRQQQRALGLGKARGNAVFEALADKAALRVFVGEVRKDPALAAALRSILAGYDEADRKAAGLEAALDALWDELPLEKQRAELARRALKLPATAMAAAETVGELREIRGRMDELGVRSFDELWGALSRPKLTALGGAIAKLQKPSLPGDARPRQFAAFLKDRTEAPNLRDRIAKAVAAGHGKALEAIVPILGGRTAREVIAGADAGLSRRLAAHGFHLADEDLKLIQRQVALTEDAERIRQMIVSPMLREQLARKKKMGPGDERLSGEMLLQAVRPKEKDEKDYDEPGAEWLADLLTKVSSMRPLGMSPERVQEVAEARLRESRLTETEASLVGATTEGAFLGFSTRTMWLLVVSFVVCVVGIANAMLMSVTERFREIATMKCLGATDGFIMISFVMESCMQGVAGSAVGLVLGFLLGTGRTAIKYGWIAISHLPAMEVLAAAGVSAALGILISALAAVYPAWVAARLAPMEAMRIE